MNEFNLQRFLNSYQTFDETTFSVLAPLYCEDATFIDPVHSVQGRDAIAEYFQTMAADLEECRFQFSNTLAQDDQVVITWQMSFRHAKLNGGETLVVDGTSHLLLRGGQVACHRDYYDLGQMIYEQIPGLGWVIRWLRRRLANSSAGGERLGDSPRHAGKHEHSKHELPRHEHL